VSIRSLRSDNAKEYLSHQFQNFMSSNGILHQTSCAHTPQQNGVAKRKTRHLIETIRTLLLRSNVPFRYWGDAVLMACYLINRMPSSVLGNQVPHSVLFLIPLYTHFHPVCLGPHVLFKIFLLVLTKGLSLLLSYSSTIPHVS